MRQLHWGTRTGGLGLVLVLLSGPAGLSAQQDSMHAMPMDHMAMMAPHAEFMGAHGHTVTGAYTLETKAGKQFLTLQENFVLDKAPDPYVVLSGDAMGASQGALNLGRLQKVKGTSSYAIPEGTDLSHFSKVIIWCKKYDVSLGIADFTPPKGEMMMK